MAVDDTPYPPAISISRTSTESRQGSLTEHTSRENRPRPRVETTHYGDPHWYRKHHADSWKRRTLSPGLEWHIKWDKNCFTNGRVLIIDYVSNQVVHNTDSSGKRHVAVAAQEFQDLKSLQAFYADPRRSNIAALRVIHVQNAKWATIFLLKKFNIDHPSEMVGMQGFTRWARYERPRQRNGKPFPNGRSFREQTDPWRNVSRTAFGLDYLKGYPTAPPNKRRHDHATFGSDRPVDAKMMHLNAYEDSRTPYGCDVSVQRLSVYVQRNLGVLNRVSPDLDVKSPYKKHSPNGTCDGDEVVELKNFDNGNTVIVFETSASLLPEDCLIQPRNDFENRWRRLSFYLKREEALNDSRLAAQCTNMILNDVFHGLAIVWEQFLSAASDHVTLLEEKIYANPADESRAPELWTNQASWLKVDKLMWTHQDLVKEMQIHMRELAEVDEDEPPIQPPDWLASAPAEYEKLGHSVQEDLVQPTANLSDLMYKSVGIRDSRQSLQLGLSMWRLSWITFIFLPLTFIVSFFGMNVDILQNYPNVGWYFLAAGILMIFVLVLWYCVKHSLQRRRQTPFQRGIYEQLFEELEEDYPLLWTHAGAADDVQPVGFSQRIKWRLLKRWFAPEKTIAMRVNYSSVTEADDTDLGAWARCKRYLLKRWLPEIQGGDGDPLALIEQGGDTSRRHSIISSHEDASTIIKLATMSTPLAVAEAEPTALQQMSATGLRPLNLSGRRTSISPRNSEDRPSSRGSSGMMFEERNLSDSESDAEHAGASDTH